MVNNYYHYPRCLISIGMILWCNGTLLLSVSLALPTNYDDDMELFHIDRSSLLSKTNQHHLDGVQQRPHDSVLLNHRKRLLTEAYNDDEVMHQQEVSTTRMSDDQQQYNVLGIGVEDLEHNENQDNAEATICQILSDCHPCSNTDQDSISECAETSRIITYQCGPKNAFGK
jgi:hypothetical protein